MPLVALQSQPEASASTDPGGHGTHRWVGHRVHPTSSAGLTSDVRSKGSPRRDRKSKVRGTTVTPLTAGPGPTTGASPVETTLPTENVADHAVVASPSPPVSVPPTTTTTTSTTAPLVAASAPVAGPGGTGQVTYYDHPAGTCASPWLPFGTEVEITNPANGESVSCVVNDREADTARSIDLATSTFALIAPLSQGVIDARLTW